MTTWAIVIASVGCLGLKLAGFAVPAGWLQDPRVQRLSVLLPVGLLSTLILTGTFASGRELVVDARAAGLAAAVAAQALRAPFLVVVAAGVLATAGVRALP